jgi:hypothetical protein
MEGIFSSVWSGGIGWGVPSVQLVPVRLIPRRNRLPGFLVWSVTLGKFLYIFCKTRLGMYAFDRCSGFPAIPGVWFLLAAVLYRRAKSWTLWRIDTLTHGISILSPSPWDEG